MQHLGVEDEERDCAAKHGVALDGYELLDVTKKKQHARPILFLWGAGVSVETDTTAHF